MRSARGLIGPGRLDELEFLASEDGHSNNHNLDIMSATPFSPALLLSSMRFFSFV